MSLITTAMGLVVFYINAVIIIHVISKVLSTILHRKGSVHLIAVNYIRYVTIADRNTRNILLWGLT